MHQQVHANVAIEIMNQLINKVVVKATSVESFTGAVSHVVTIQ